MLKKGVSLMVRSGGNGPWRFWRLSDHQLADIGIPRAQIREVVESLVGRNGHPRKDTGTTTAEVSATVCCADS